MATKMSWGIPHEKQIVPKLPINYDERVLEIGPGTGKLLPFLIEIYGGNNVYAMQPRGAGREYSSENDSVSKIVEPQHFFETTLQAYITNRLRDIKYGLIFIYKWNIPLVEADAFCHALSQILQPGGTIYITSVERERFQRNYSTTEQSPMFIRDKLLQYFMIIKDEVIKVPQEGYEKYGGWYYGAYTLKHKA